MTLPAGSVAGIKGGWLVASVAHTYPSEMAQNFWTAIFAWSTCFVVTILVQSGYLRLGVRKTEVGLVSLFEQCVRPKRTWFGTSVRAVLGCIVLGMTLVLNIIFW